MKKIHVIETDFLEKDGINCWGGGRWSAFVESSEPERSECIEKLARIQFVAEGIGVTPATPLAHKVIHVISPELVEEAYLLTRQNQLTAIKPLSS